MPSNELCENGYKRDAATITDSIYTSSATAMTDPALADAGSMTVLSASGLEELEEECNNLRRECKSLREECAKLREKIRDLELSEHSFKDDDNKVRYYTGLPCFATLMTIFNFVTGLSFVKLLTNILVISRHIACF